MERRTILAFLLQIASRDEKEMFFKYSFCRLAASDGELTSRQVIIPLLPFALV